MTELIPTAPCTYALLDSGIHEFAFLQSSRAAVDCLFNHLTEVYANIPDDQTALLLFDAREGDLPLAYLFMSFQRWSAARATHIPARLAIFTDAHALVPLVDTFLRTLRTPYLRVRFFSHEQRDDAEDWLLEDF